MYSLAIHLDGPFWKVALLTFRDDIPQIVLLKTLEGEETPLDALKAILYKKPYSIASALPADAFLLRELEMEIKGWNNVLSALPFQAEELIPFPKEQAIVLPFLESFTDHSSNVRLLSTKREYLETHISSLNAKGIDPHFVTTAVHALKRWALFVLPEHPSSFVVYLSKEQSFVILLRNKEIAEFKLFSIDRVGDWHRIKEYFTSRLTEGETFPWISAGDPHLLGEEIPSSGIPEQLQSFALPIGIGLENLARDGKSVQWRKEELEPPSLQKKQTKSLIFILALLGGASAIFGPLGHLFLANHSEALFQRAQTALEKIGSPVKRMDISEMLDLLQMQKSQLDEEKRLGSYSPTVTLFLTCLSETLGNIDKVQLPAISSLRYEINARGEPHLDVELDCPSKESVRCLKTLLSNLQTLRIAKWKEKDLNVFISLKQL